MNKQITAMVSQVSGLFEQLAQFNEEDRIDAINAIRLALHEHSPMKDHPVDCVLWVRQEDVHSNTYNPNRVAPPEMALLERSVMEDGYTQPVVVWQEEQEERDSSKESETYEIVDGWHRSLVARFTAIYARVKGRLPITVIHKGTGLPHRIAATVRHDRARGEPSTELMQNIVSELVQAGMSERWIMQHFGMDADELLRLKQLTGLAALFKDKEFSRSWVGVDRGDMHD